MKSGPRQSLVPGDVLGGRYEIVCEIAVGGMGAIFLGKQRGLGRKVAIKTIRPDREDRPEMVARFQREAMAVQALTHPNTIRIYDFGREDDDTLYLVMEYLEGKTLRSVLQEHGPIAVDQAVDIWRQVLKCLIEAHGQGVVHRDIKPDNLMLVEQPGEENFIKVLDFGLAHMELDDDFQTRSGEALGTACYMSPEQVRGQGVDTRTDIYALGHTLLELITGAPAYRGKAFEVAMRHINLEPVPIPPELVGTGLGAVLAKALAKDVNLRWSSATETLAALDAVLEPSRGGPTEAFELATSVPASEVVVPTASRVQALATELDERDTVLTESVADEPVPVSRWASSTNLVLGGYRRNWLVAGLGLIALAMAVWVALTGEHEVPAAEEDQAAAVVPDPTSAPDAIPQEPVAVAEAPSESEQVSRAVSLAHQRVHAAEITTLDLAQSVSAVQELAPEPQRSRDRRRTREPREPETAPVYDIEVQAVEPEGEDDSGGGEPSETAVQEEAQGTQEESVLPIFF